MTAIMIRHLQGESDAIHVICNPHLHQHNPNIIRNAWMILKSRSGHPVVQHRLAHIPVEVAND
jgi:hypothetical protein